jgi:hypothetical protein
MVTIIYGGITNHYLAPSLPYCNTVNNYGTIHNEYVIGMVGDEEFKAGILKGRDSACGEITGAVTSTKIIDDVDFVFGGYNTNFKEFKELGIMPPSVYGITPVLGANFKVSLYKNENYELKLENIVSLGITSHAISVNF